MSLCENPTITYQPSHRFGDDRMIPAKAFIAMACW